MSETQEDVRECQSDESHLAGALVDAQDELATLRAQLAGVRERVLQLDRYGFGAPDVVLSRVVLGDVLALLDAGRKDRERLDWMEHQSEYGRVALDTNNPEFDNSEPKYTVYASAKGGRKFGDTLRAAIDKARGA